MAIQRPKGQAGAQASRWAVLGKGQGEWMETDASVGQVAAPRGPGKRIAALEQELRLAKGEADLYRRGCEQWKETYASLLDEKTALEREVKHLRAQVR